MAFVVHLVAEYATWIYIACGLIAFWYLYRAWMVRRERRQAVFALEREEALNDLYQILSVAVMLLVVMGMVYFTSTVLADVVEPYVEEVLTPSGPVGVVTLPTPFPTPDVTSFTPTPTTQPVAIAQASTPPPAEEQTPTPTSTPAPTEPPPPTPTPEPVALPPSCPDGRAVLTQPGVGAVVSGSAAIMGTAVHETFDFYKLEFGPSSDGPWSWFDGAHRQIQSGPLGVFHSNAVPNGTYYIQLTVVDRTGNYPSPCQVRVNVQN